MPHKPARYWAYSKALGQAYLDDKWTAGGTCTCMIPCHRQRNRPKVLYRAIFEETRARKRNKKTKQKELARSYPVPHERLPNTVTMKKKRTLLMLYHISVQVACNKMALYQVRAEETTAFTRKFSKV